MHELHAQFITAQHNALCGRTQSPKKRRDWEEQDERRREEEARREREESRNAQRMALFGS